MILSSVAELLLQAGSELDDPELFEEVVEVIGNSLAAGGGSLLHLAQAHRMRYEHDGAPETLARAEAAAREAVAQYEEHDLDAADEYAELAQVLRYRSDRSDDPRVAREAAIAARESLHRTAPTDEEHTKRACLLAGALTECHYAGDAETLAEAVGVVRAALASEAVRVGEVAGDRRGGGAGGVGGSAGGGIGGVDAVIALADREVGVSEVAGRSVAEGSGGAADAATSAVDRGVGVPGAAGGSDVDGTGAVGGAIALADQGVGVPGAAGGAAVDGTGAVDAATSLADLGVGVPGAASSLAVDGTSAADAATPVADRGVGVPGTAGGSDADGTSAAADTSTPSAGHQPDTPATTHNSPSPGTDTAAPATTPTGLLSPSATPTPPPGRSDVWQIGAAVLCEWADQHEDIGVVEEAERAVRVALVLAGGEVSRRADALDTLADVLRCGYLLSGDPGVLEEAILHAAEAASLRVGPPGDRAGRIGKLGVLLLFRHEETGEPADLDADIDLQRSALALVGDDHPDARIHFNNLSIALAARTRLHGGDGVDDLDDAIAAGRAAVRGDGPAHQRVLRLSNLGGALYARYTRDGRLADLDEDIDLQREALRLVPTGHPERPGLLSNLATALTERHEALGVRDDLSEALTYLEEAMATGPAPRRVATIAGAHGLALHARYSITGDQDTLERALASLRTAVEATAPTDPHLPFQLANLAVSLREASTHRAAAAAEAVDAARGALTVLDEGRTATAVRGSLLLALAARSGDGDLDEAVTLAHRVVADTPPDDPDLSRSLANLAYVLNLRHQSTDAGDDLAGALDALRAAARTGTGPADVRLHAAR
ncbi:hypothetical protein R5A26_47600, partial [Streptomyces prunicolor]|nr:hypothetical protein [Streptomyces prunicolor]